MRLFIAIFPPEEILAQIREDMRKLDKIKRNFKFTPYDQMHLTLKFLGASVSHDSFEVIANILNENSAEFIKPTITIERLQYGFQAQIKPNVMVYPVEPNKSLKTTTDAIHSVTKNARLADVIQLKERNKFTHHFTIARSKRSISNSLVNNTRSFLSDLSFEKKEFEANEFYIVDSVITNKGNEYRKLSKIQMF